MNTHYVLTRCTALVIGGALIAGSANAVGQALRGLCADPLRVYGVPACAVIVSVMLLGGARAHVHGSRREPRRPHRRRTYGKSRTEDRG